MQLTVTVVWPAAGWRADVVIDADPGTTVAQAAAELARLVRGTSGPAVPALFAGGHQVPGDVRLADAPVLDGCVVSLGDPVGGPRPEPAGVAELRVAGGPAAGAVYQLGFEAADIGGPAAGTTAPTRPRCCRSRRVPGGGCGSAAAPTRTTCCSGSAPPTCRLSWSSPTRPPTSTAGACTG